MSKIKVALLYSKADGATFDSDYWLNNHRPMILSGIWSTAKNTEFSLCREDDPYFALATGTFDSREELIAALSSGHGDATSNDLANFFSGSPTILVTELQN
jgi:uncharacterized protein (TIGR02118 family)